MVSVGFQNAVVIPILDIQEQETVSDRNYGVGGL